MQGRVLAGTWPSSLLRTVQHRTEPRHPQAPRASSGIASSSPRLYVEAWGPRARKTQARKTQALTGRQHALILPTRRPITKGTDHEG